MDKKELRNFYRRVLFTSISGVILASLFHFINPIILCIYPVVIILGMKKYNFKDLFFKAKIICLGFYVGTINGQIFQGFPFLQSIVAYTIFITVLKLFAHKHKAMNALMFTMTFTFSSIFGSYLESSYEILVYEYWLQVLWVFTLVTLSFFMFPSKIKSAEPISCEAAKMKDKEILFYALILLLIWEFFMFFELRFAYFPYIIIISLFMEFDINNAKYKALENIKAHTKACIITSFFSLLIFGMNGNIFLLILGLFLIFIPIVKRGIYPEDPKKMYHNITMISGLIVPLTLYLSTDGAALYKSTLRAFLLNGAMLFMIFIFGLFQKN